MAERTSIEWADSSCNAEMGCDGCELWVPKQGVKRCYAGTMTAQYKGRPGWPEAFDKPKLFTDRIDKACHWKDLTGRKRIDKPWLDGMPRMIFLNDMGDTFTESLPVDWLADWLPLMAATPHVWLLLTKRATRMADFSKRHPLPPNVWPGVSITTMSTVKRVEGLFKVKGGGPRWLSVEPLIETIELTQRFEDGSYRDLLNGQFFGLQCKGVNGYPDFVAKTDDESLPSINWVIVGGESGEGARPCDLAWIRAIVDHCRAEAVPCFVKQLGGNPVGLDYDFKRVAYKGNDESEFPPDLQNQRNFPDPDAFKVPRVSEDQITN
jgi:protein gp37